MEGGGGDTWRHLEGGAQTAVNTAVFLTAARASRPSRNNMLSQLVVVSGGASHSGSRPTGRPTRSATPPWTSVGWRPPHFAPSHGVCPLTWRRPQQRRADPPPPPMGPPPAQCRPTWPRRGARTTNGSARPGWTPVSARPSAASSHSTPTGCNATAQGHRHGRPRRSPLQPAPATPRRPRRPGRSRAGPHPTEPCTSLCPASRQKRRPTETAAGLRRGCRPGGAE